MSAIGSLVSALNPLSLVGETAEKLCDAFLPKQLEFIGDLVSLTIDLKTGNYVKAAQDLQDLFQDLPEQLAQLKKRSDRAAASVSEAVSEQIMEPTPPPLRSTARDSKTSPDTENGKAEEARTDKKKSQAAQREAAQEKTSQTNSAKDEKTKASDEARSKAAAKSSADSKKTDQKADDKAEKKSESKTAKAPAARGDAAAASDKPDTTTGSSGANAVTANEFFRLSDTDLMDAVKTGRIPDSVRKDAAQMAALQARIHEITEMNQMITQMLHAMHQMTMAVIQNVRV